MTRVETLHTTMLPTAELAALEEENEWLHIRVIDLETDKKQLKKFLKDANRGAELNSKVSRLWLDEVTELRARVAELERVLQEAAFRSAFGSIVEVDPVTQIGGLLHELGHEVDDELVETAARYLDEEVTAAEVKEMLRDDLAASFAAGLKIEQRARECEARVAELEGLLRRYRKEVPLGHQPHMIAHEVDTALGREE